MILQIIRNETLRIAQSSHYINSNVIHSNKQGMYTLDSNPTVLSAVAVSKDIKVIIRIVGPDLNTTPHAVSVSVSVGTPVLRAMELAAAKNTLYRFSGTN